MLSRLLFRLARQPWMGFLVGVGFAYGSRWMPVRRVMETARVVAFYHPRPSWKGHVLIVPKRRIPTLLDLHDLSLLEEIVQVAGQVAGGRTAVLCANGGARQDVRQMHFHLIPDERWVGPGAVEWEVDEAIGFCELRVVVERLGLGARGYSLVLQDPGAAPVQQFHLIAGDRRGGG